MSSSSGRRPGHSSRGHRPPKKPKMSDEEWKKSLATFKDVVDNVASDDRSIQQAWETLLHDYRNKFNAKVSAHSAQHIEEPFGLWAADNLRESAIERVLCLVFRKELAQCNHITLLRSTATKANTTVWNMLLFFGASMFSESLLGKVRKRLRVFNRDPVTGTSNFKPAYMRVLRAHARRTKISLDTTSIATLNAIRVFTSPDLTAMASANPEFDLPPRKTGCETGSLQVKGQDASHVDTDQNRSVRKQGVTQAKKKKPGGTASTQEIGNGVSEDIAPAGGETIKPSIEFNIPDSQPNLAGPRDTGTGPKSLRSESEGQQNFLPSVSSTTSSDPPRDIGSRRNPPRKGRPGKIDFGIVATEIGEASVDDDENNVSLVVKATPSSKSGATGSNGELRQARAGSTVYCASPMSQARSKRPLQIQENEQTVTSEEGRKRPKTTHTRSSLLGSGWEWDDETVLAILHQLESTGHPDYVVVDGLSHKDASTRKQLTGEAGRRGSLLVPLKLDAGQRLLVVVELNTRGKLGTGVMRYYDPCGPPEEDSAAAYAPAMKLAPLLAHVLPDQDLNPTLWEMQYCVCPELFCEQDSGIAICMGAMYAVGGRPLPEVIDWTFWRHLLLGAFFPDDAALQLRISHYRDDVINKLIRQGQMSDGVSVPRGRRVSSDIEYLGTAAMNPVDRIECRANNARKIIEVVHEGHNIFHSLQEKDDQGRADAKTRLDKSIHIRDSLRRKLNIGDQIVLGARIPKVESDEETAEGFDKLTLQHAIEEHSLCTTLLEGLSASNESIHQALHIVAAWRRDVMAAVMEDDASISDKWANKCTGEA
ncbi:hypothetical protein KVR01_005706 [Diaporthe batatas]|uniref:uncharacterized protein n=1 Tax=Diaporthe batatas TaxID=748121 RepID=UPI001D047B41|nr:uncharacterized protein KVR01_005706 [Diaporthe batatas]KAG8165431.1 hypothetical protein KVR01_005706 [Diaporthe batatas]